MTSVRDIAIDVLSPLVGAAMATLYVSQAAANLGVGSESLTPREIDQLAQQFRKLMGAFCSAALLEEAIDEIRARCAQ